MYRLIKLTVLLHLLAGIDGAITLNCWATSPVFRHSVTCSCKNLAGTGVEWWENTNLVSICFFSVNCSPNPSGYTFSVNQTEQMFTMTVNPYNYSECQQFTCKDFTDTSIQQSQKPLIIDFDSTMPLAIAEPALDNTDGDISITTSCISGYSDLIAKWYIVVDGTKKEYIPDQDIVIRQINATACIACNSESAATIKLGFQHKEAVANEASEGHFQLELSHPDYPLDKLVLNTSNVYKVAISGDSDRSNRNGCGLLCISLLSVGVLFTGIIIMVIVLFVINGKPIRPNGFKAAANGVTERSITVQWEPGDGGGLPQTFVLMYEGQQYEKNQEAREHTFEKLSKGTYYTFSIFARNEIGSSEVATLYLRTNGPPDPPEHFCVIAYAVTESSIDVEWKPGFDGGFTQEFILKCFINDQDLQKEEPIPDTKGQTIVHTIKELSAYTYYELRIFSKNIKGASKTLPPITTRTKRLPNVN